MSDMNLETVRQNLRIAIALRNTTAAEVSRKAGLSINAVGSFIRGNTSISFANLASVARVIDIPLSLLSLPDAITPGRIQLQKEIERLPVEDLRRAVQHIQNGRSES